MRQVRAGLALAVLNMCFLGCMAQGSAQTALAAQPVLKVAFEREGVPVPKWSLEFYGEGRGHYDAWPAKGDAVSRDFVLTPETWNTLQTLMAGAGRLQHCETKAKGLARVGQKTVQWVTPEGDTVGCTFNYSDNKALSAAATLWSGVASTMEMGQWIAHDHRYDRLGLDAALSNYEKMLDSGMANDPEIIAPELQALVADVQLMDRVRSRAQRILERRPSK